MTIIVEMISRSDFKEVILGVTIKIIIIIIIIIIKVY